MATSEKGDNPLHISWCDSTWIPGLNHGTILKYFSQRSNPFYDSACNNELIKMQGLSLEHLGNMTGVEYTVLHCQEPILYIIRKQIRHSPTQVTAVADYYIIAGIVYQAPDVKSVVNSRLTSAMHHIDSALSEAVSYSRYHPSKGYWWQFNDENKGDGKEKVKKKKKEEPGSIFQCGRVDQLLENLRIKYPHQFYQAQPGGQPIPVQQNGTAAADIKSERVDQTSANMQALPAGQQSAAGNATSGGVNVHATQSPIPPNSQTRVKSELIEGMKPPFEKRTKYS